MNENNLVVDYYSHLHEIRSFAGQAKVNLQFKEVAPGEKFCPHAKEDTRGNRTIVVEKPSATWSADEFAFWRYTVLHEIGHFAPEVEDSYALLKEKELSSGSTFCQIMNCFEDYRQEKNNLGKYVGRDMVLSKGNKLGVDRIINEVGERLGQNEPGSDGEIWSTLVSFSSETRESWQRDVIGQHKQLQAFYNPKQMEYIDKLSKGDYGTKLDKCKTALDIYNLTRDVLTNIFERDADEEERKSREQAKSERANAQSGDGDTSDGGSVDSDGEESSDSLHGDKDGEERSAQAVHWSEVQPALHDIAESATYTPTKINYTDYDDPGTFNMCLDVDVRDYTKDSGSGNERYKARVLEHNLHSGLSNKVRKLLQVKTQTMNMYGMKRGKVANKNVFRAAMSNDVGSYRERVFKKKIQRYDLDVSVTVLCDFSGSMGGDKMVHNIISALMLNESISRIGVPVEILGFTDGYRNSIISIFKTFDGKVNTEQLLERMCSGTNCMENNADGESILFAHDRLIKRNEKRKLLLVLSDGQPASGRGDCKGFTKRVIQKIEQERRTEIYGIGILDNTVEELYKHNHTINHADELEKAVLTVVKNYILK